MLAVAGSCSESPRIPKPDLRSKSHHFAVRKKIRKNIQSKPVIGIVEYRDQNHSIRNIEIGVARGQTLSRKNHRGGQGKFNDGEGFPSWSVAARRRRIFSRSGS